MQSSWSPEHYEAEIKVLKQSQAAQKRVIEELRNQLRLAQEQATLANDKMAEQVRQARWEVADDLLASWHATPGGKLMDLLVMVENVRAANAQKD